MGNENIARDYHGFALPPKEISAGTGAASNELDILIFDP
jgi:hypothetical protein